MKMFQTPVVLLLALIAACVQATPIGLSPNATAVCASTCNWNDTLIWSTGTVPGVGDDVTIQNTDTTVTLVIDVPISISSFTVSQSNKQASNIKIVSGGSLTISGTSTLGYTTVMTIESGASFTVSGQITNRGLVTVQGNFSALASATPSLDIDTQNGQISTTQVYATVTLDGGYLIAPGGVHVSSTANLLGDGHIIGNVASTGTISMGTSSSVGTLYITGQLVLSTTTTSVGDSKLKVKVASATSFDHIIISDVFVQDGDLIVTPLNNYEPLAHTQFIFANHSSQRGGFDTTRGSGFQGVFNNKWTSAVDQQYTFVIYDSASTVAISVFLVVVCAFLTL
eukprot:TRINITY_DN217_c0_g1_i1.p1 TRINITY_DN217_c0_g1~~TRINITY_DN217_c0_g1_i1.p1  ORF type:complete len:340 (+),score=97.96 TRINITY_DN217_c0_g1_i1:100-1119(+)